MQRDRIERQLSVWRQWGRSFYQLFVLLSSVVYRQSGLKVKNASPSPQTLCTSRATEIGKENLQH